MTTEIPMHVRNALLTTSLLLGSACGGASSDALQAATPSYTALALDQETTDTKGSALTSSTGTEAAAMVAGPTGEACHPHLFVRQREVVERVNRHLFKALHHVEEVIASKPLTTTDSTRVWERVVNGVDRKFTITLVSPDVYSWELDAGPAGTTPLPVVLTGQIDRSAATGPHQGKGTLHIDFANLFAAYPAEKVKEGTLDVAFDLTAASRQLTVTASGIAWDLDPTMFDSASVLAALSAPRSGAYVYDREPGKGGSLKIQDQMVFACPSNPSLVAADAQLVARWYRAADGSVHGRSDALMQHGQLPAAGVDRVVAVTCHRAGGDGLEQSEGFWLMKAEDAAGTTLTGFSSATLDPTASPCDPIFGDVPLLADATKDFTSWPASYSDGVPFPFPGM